jgi:outer membrane lipoprotein LolB
MRALAAAAAFALLGACAALGPAPAPRAAPFDLLGRVLVSYDGRAFASNLRWRHGAADDEIWLLTPAGQALVHIVDAPGGAVLTGADGQQLRAGSVEALTRRALGWELPLARLQYWVRGRPAPEPAPQAQQRDADGRLALLAQDGWRIAYTHHAPDRHGGLPRRLELDGGGQQIRLVIDDWRAGTAAP